MFDRTKINENEAGVGPFYKKLCSILTIDITSNPALLIVIVLDDMLNNIVAT